MASQSLISCAHITLKDSTWWGSLQGAGAREFHVLTPDARTISLGEFLDIWYQYDDPIACTRASTFADWKSIIETLCSQPGTNCTYEAKEKARVFFEEKIRVPQNVN